jgi:hypothetical protein
MSTRFAIALLLSGMVGGVLFGVGAILVLSIPQLSQHAAIFLPLVIVLSFILSPGISWVMAPSLRARHPNPVAVKSGAPSVVPLPR